MSENENKIIPESQEINFEEKAAQHYSDSLPYHNFSHVGKAQERAREIIAECQKEKVPIDSQVVNWALLYHDAGYHLDHVKMGYKTKEEFSAVLARQDLEKAGVEENIIVQVEEAIIATHRDAPFITNEAKAVRAADLSTMAGPYDEFLDVNQRLRAEVEMMTGQKISWEEWKEKTGTLIDFYLNQDIRLTRAHDDEEGNSIFHKKVRENLERLRQEKE